mmetsp:Transcript_14763/g.51747  ORF Transcript_14763/g.51747 Transcript_14763/m.51747 type:complete len:250 (-) Transcript_14763:56-805(-)
MSCVACCAAIAETATFNPKQTTVYSHAAASPDVLWDDPPGCPVPPEVIDEARVGAQSLVEARAAAAAAAAGEVWAFDVLLTWPPGQSAGLRLDSIDGSALRIMEVAPGPVAMYNDSVEPERQICPGDFIIEVSGIRKTAKEMFRELLKGGDVKLAISRPFVFTTGPIRKGDGAIGLDLSYHPKAGSVIVQGFCDEGAIPRYNTCVESDLQVKLNDYIVGVNGDGGTAVELVQRLTNSEVIELRITRPAC